ncbi:hypothetical protein BCR35DRAFT_290630 [Leucosporidium creatinivorum]|uniref:Store-operated calcium entry-associated regulatory factor n=1 Tax=Leucosporidium creatinivorum TaxID=106004 RepID=A0A1Y2FG30_9BASI|nr:hypothetical protein BCR35DRAFT_290630 [Leucosporidium creatinivorum]
MTRSQRIPMSKLNALTLHSNRLTTSRRTSPVPQLKCQGKACRIYEPDVVQCTAVGEDGSGGLEWSCTAELPKGIRFGAVEVGCEGWDSSDDPYILKGSCGLTYNLVHTSSALEDSGPSYLPRFSSSSSAPHPLISLSLLLLTLYALYTYLYPRRRSITNFFRSGPSNWGGWGGGGGGGGGGPGFGGGPPPPPYSSKPPEPQGAGWRPGFWTGALAGALGTQAAQGFRNRAGYTNAQEERFRQRQAGWGGGLRDDGFGWGGAGGRPTRSGGEGASGSGGGMRQSTGFGGTRNR